MCPADISVKNLFHRHTVVHNVDKAQCKVRNKKDNVAGNLTLIIIVLKAGLPFSFGLGAETILSATRTKENGLLSL